MQLYKLSFIFIIFYGVSVFNFCVVKIFTVLIIPEYVNIYNKTILYPKDTILRTPFLSVL